MKMSIPVVCSSCRTEFIAQGYGNEQFPPALCPSCGQNVWLLDPLSFCVIAVRLFNRADVELRNGDYTLPIVLSAMAIEASLTSLFFKWRRLESGFINNKVSTTQQKQWEREYRKGVGRGGFLNSANFVMRDLAGKEFDDFVADFLTSSSVADKIRARLTMAEGQMKASSIHAELFEKRNRIMHWGKADYNRQASEAASLAGRIAFAVLGVADRKKYEAWSQNLPALLSAPSSVNP